MPVSAHRIARVCISLALTAYGRRVRENVRSSLGSIYQSSEAFFRNSVLPSTPIAAFGASVHALRSDARTFVSGSRSHRDPRMSALATAVATQSVSNDGKSAEERMCAPGSVAGGIEDAIKRVYGFAGTARVRKSLRALSEGVELDRVLDPSNELMVQKAHSYVDSLTAVPWWDPSQFKWAWRLEKEWQVVRDELREALSDGRLENGYNIWGRPKAETSKHASDWRTLPICDRTVWDSTNSALFPKTCDLLTRSKVPVVEAFFAQMPPKTDIKPHSDSCNFVLTSHLGIEIPEGECDLTVGNATVEWRNGQVLLFDTSILHAAENRADKTRYILMMRIYHPELSKTEKAALKLVFDCLDEPDLTHDLEALDEYEERRSAVEAASAEAWLATLGKKKGKQKKKRKR